MYNNIIIISCIIISCMLFPYCIFFVCMYMYCNHELRHEFQTMYSLLSVSLFPTLLPSSLFIPSLPGFQTPAVWSVGLTGECLRSSIGFGQSLAARRFLMCFAECLLWSKLGGDITWLVDNNGNLVYTKDTFASVYNGKVQKMISKPAQITDGDIIRIVRYVASVRLLIQV